MMNIEDGQHTFIGNSLGSNMRGQIVKIGEVREMASAGRLQTLVPGGALLGFDGHIHIDSDWAHLVLTPGEARAFAAALSRLADALEDHEKDTA